MNYTLQISALGEHPLSLSNASLPEWGHALIRSRDGIITGVIFDITASAVSDYPFEYLEAVRNCIFSHDREGLICLDNEGQSIYIELSLRPDSNIFCSVDVTEFEPNPFIDGTSTDFSLDGTNIRNESLGDKFYLTFSSSISSWCDSVIDLAKDESPAYQLSIGGDPNTVCDANGYIRDLEIFRDKMAKRLDNQTVDQIISEIEPSKAAPVIRKNSANL